MGRGDTGEGEKGVQAAGVHGGLRGQGGERQRERERKRDRKRAHGRHPRCTFLNRHNLQPRPGKLSAFMQKGRHKARRRDDDRQNRTPRRRFSFRRRKCLIRRDATRTQISFDFDSDPSNNIADFSTISLFLRRSLTL